MIASFQNKWLGRFWQRNDRLGLSRDAAPRIARILSLLDGAETVDDLDVPGFGFQRIAGTDPQRYAIHVIANYRVTCLWRDSMAEAVDLDEGYGD